MVKLSRLSGLVGAMTLAVVALAFASTPSLAKHADSEFKCKAKGVNEIEIHVRYEERTRAKGVRKKFDAEFEARTGGSFNSGQLITIVVDAVVVGSFRLTPAPSGELSGELEFDTKVSKGHTAFPANFPAVQAGLMVEAKVGANTVLGCQLR